MKITLLPSAVGSVGENAHQYATSFVINDRVAIDAGAIGFWQTPTEQAGVRHLFLSHTHMDHLASLPIFLENIAGLSDAPVVVHASAEVQECLRLDVFNGRVWANFLELTHDDKPFVLLQTIRSGEVVEVEGLRITPIAVNHVVPTLGFIIEDPTAAVVIPSDTGPTGEIWARAQATPNLKAVFLEATFPNAFESLAELTKHLTPAGFVHEMQKLARPVKYYAVHLKARYRDQVAQELLAHRLANVEIAKFGTAYEF